MLAVIETHPVQYHAPVYRALQQDCGVPITAIYGSDFSVAGYADHEFRTTLAWDTDLLGGYQSRFLARVAEGGARSDAAVNADGLRAALADVRPRATLLLGYSPRFHRQAFLAARRCRVPLLFRGETTDHARRRGAWKRWLRDRGLRWLYGQCARLLYVGERSRSHFRRLGCAEGKLVFSPYCVDTTPFHVTEADRQRMRESTRAELALAADDVAVLFSGKLSGRKGPDLLVRAAQSLTAAGRDHLALLFLGDGELRSALAAAVTRSPTLRAHFLGFRNQTELSRFFHAADVLALPSVSSETWGLVVNEALHHGVPVVVSDGVGCAPDLVTPGVTGEACRAGSVEELAGAIVRAERLVNRDEVRAACRQRVSGYSVRAAAEGIARAYRDVVTGAA
jgi:glycosyltransferase involved in cell wall biosynthesis